MHPVLQYYRYYKILFCCLTSLDMFEIPTIGRAKIPISVQFGSQFINKLPLVAIRLTVVVQVIHTYINIYLDSAI